MKKYVTAREMPFIKVGSELVYTKQYGGRYELFYDNHPNEGSVLLSNSTLEAYLDEGWIKELPDPTGTTPTPVNTREIEKLKYVDISWTMDGSGERTDSQVLAEKLNQVIDALNALRREGGES